MVHDRRIGIRVPLEMFLNQYIDDRPVRALSADVSETGLSLARVTLPQGDPSAPRRIGLEFELPGTGEVIWARGQVCRERRGSIFVSTGVRFDAMARSHARLVRDFCLSRRRSQLSDMLARIRRRAP